MNMIDQDTLNGLAEEFSVLYVGIVDEVIAIMQSMPPDDNATDSADNLWSQFTAREAQQKTAVEDYSEAITAICRQAVTSAQMDARTTMYLWLITPQAREWSDNVSGDIILPWSTIHQDITTYVCKYVYDIASEFDKQF
jgi:hypothetical protein